MKTKEKRQSAQDKLMHGMQGAISSMKAETPNDLEVRNAAIEQFRRIEKLFGYEPKSWPAFV